MYLEHYLKELNYYNMPEFLFKYLNSSSLVRLKKVGYFWCFAQFVLILHLEKDYL